MQKKEGATHTQWRASCDYDGDSDTCEVSTFYNKTESDEDFEIRVMENEIKIETERKMREQKEREDYERLKSKFENEK